MDRNASLWAHLTTITKTSISTLTIKHKHKTHCNVHANNWCAVEDLFENTFVVQTQQLVGERLRQPSYIFCWWVVRFPQHLCVLVKVFLCASTLVTFITSLILAPHPHLLWQCRPLNHWYKEFPFTIHHYPPIEFRQPKMNLVCIFISFSSI